MVHVKVRLVSGLKIAVATFFNGKELKSVHCLIRQETHCAKIFIDMIIKAVYQTCSEV